MAAKEKTLAEKLLLKPGTPLALVNAPKDQPQPEGTSAAALAGADAVLLYAKDTAELDRQLTVVAKRLRADARLWIAYPKAGQLGTDLSRDVLWKRLEPRGLEPCRQVALDATWSAMWFKPA